jgi:hypothetical protein
VSVVAQPHPQSRPEARVFRVEDLIQHAKAGRIRVPPFQRAFKWERDDVEKLVDSIVRGYPIGTLLLWSQPAPAGPVVLGDLAFDVNEQAHAWFVVDGQQRIVSLVSTLLPGTRRADKFDLYFDLLTSEVAHRSRGGTPPTHLPLNRAVDSEELLAWLDQNRGSLTREQVRLAVRIGKLLREYEVPSYVVSIDDEQVVRAIFERTNNAGKPLAVNEVFNALHAPLGGHPPASLKDVVDRLREKSLGEIEEAHVLRSLLTLEGKDRSGDLQRQLAGVDVPAAIERVERALNHVFGFLAQDAGIPHLSLLPYASPLVVLSSFFDRFPTPSARSRRLLARWLWRGTASEELRGDGKGMRPALEALRAALDDESAAADVLATVSRQRPTPTPEPFNLRHARSRVLAMALVQLRPRSLLTGDLLDSAALLSTPADAFPQILSRKSEVARADQDDLYSSSGNRLLHPAVRGVSLFSRLEEINAPALPLDAIGGAGRHVLASHGVDDATAGFLSRGDRPGFLAARRDWLESYATKLVDSRAEWDHSDRPSIASLSKNDDED